MKMLSLGLGFAMVVMTQAHAEYGVMIAGNDYCKAEIRAGKFGNANAAQLPLIYSGPVQKNAFFKQGEGIRICARREGMPGDCNSPVSNNWLCVSPYADLSVGEPVENTF